MAVGVSRSFGPRLQGRRRAAWAVLVLGVVAVHGCVTDDMIGRMAEATAEQSAPARIEVAYVRELALSAPPPAARAKPAAPAAAPRRVAKPAVPASAPEPAPPIAAVVLTEVPLPEQLADGSASAPAPSGAASAASDADGPEFEWPASTRVSYALTGNYRGEVKGSAQVEWVRVGSHYQVHVDFIVGPAFAPLITQRSSSDGEITANGLAPRRYDQDTKVLMVARPRQTILFDAGMVVLANGDVREALPGVQDTASQFVQLTYLFSLKPELLRIGGSVDVPLALPKKIGIWTYDVVDEELMDTPVGPLTGIHLKPRRDEQKAGTISVEMWMAPQLRYLPARLRFEQDANTYVDLVIAKPPELAH